MNERLVPMRSKAGAVHAVGGCSAGGCSLFLAPYMYGELRTECPHESFDLLKMIRSQGLIRFARSSK